MSEFDNAMAELRAWAKRVGAERVDVRVRQDGRVTFTLLSASLYTMTEIDADLEHPSSLDPPNQALHAMAEGWCGR